MNAARSTPRHVGSVLVRTLAATLVCASCGPPRAEDQSTPVVDASDVTHAPDARDGNEADDTPDSEATDSGRPDPHDDDGSEADTPPSSDDAADDTPGTQPSGPPPDPERCPDGTYFTPNVTVESPTSAWAARISRIEPGEPEGRFVLTVQLFDAEGEWGAARQGRVTIEGASGSVASPLTETSLGGVYQTEAPLAPPEGDVWTLRVELIDEPVDAFVFIFCRGDV